MVINQLLFWWKTGAASRQRNVETRTSDVLVVWRVSRDQRLVRHFSTGQWTVVSTGPRFSPKERDDLGGVTSR